MQTHPETFPPERRNDPMRRAEARVFDEIGRSHLPGFVYYEWQRDRRSPQLDLATWLSNVGRFGLQVKGGQYALWNGQWYLQTGNRLERKDSPVRQTWDATMALHDELVQILGYKAFLIPVLVFPDMEPDQDIAANAERSNVHVIWGVDGLVDRLQEIATETGVFNPPNREDIAREVAAVTDGQVLYEPRNTPAPAPHGNPSSLRIPPHSRTEITTGSITIQHVDTLIVNTVPAHPPPINGMEEDETAVEE